MAERVIAESDLVGKLDPKNLTDPADKYINMPSQNFCFQTIRPRLGMAKIYPIVMGLPLDAGNGLRKGVFFKRQGARQQREERPSAENTEEFFRITQVRKAQSLLAVVAIVIPFDDQLFSRGRRADVPRHFAHSHAQM